MGIDIEQLGVVGEDIVNKFNLTIKSKVINYCVCF